MAFLGRKAAAATFVAARPEDVDLEDAPINKDWIVSGQPVARAGLHSESAAQNTSTNIWECTAGSFWWTFYDEETVVILEGCVHVTTEDGSRRSLKAGDIAFFARNSKALWEIDDYVKKIAFCRHPASAQVLALRTVLGKLKRRALPYIWSGPVLGTIGAMLPI